MLVGLKSRVAQFDFSVFYVWSLAFRRGLDPYAATLPVLAARLHLSAGPISNLDCAIHPLMDGGIMGSIGTRRHFRCSSNLSP